MVPDRALVDYEPRHPIDANQHAQTHLEVSHTENDPSYSNCRGGEQGSINPRTQLNSRTVLRNVRVTTEQPDADCKSWLMTKQFAQ